MQELDLQSSGEPDSAASPAQHTDVEPLDRLSLEPAAGEDGSLAQTVREQLARDYHEIERATAALRRAEPALESWTHTPPNLSAKTHSVWLIIGLLWLSTALLTVGAVAAIAALVG